MSFRQAAVVCLLCWAIPYVAHGETSGKKKSSNSTRPLDTNDLSRKTFKQILDEYLFIADFNQKPSERPVSKEVFWKYPFKLAPVSFELDLANKDLRSMVFQFKGRGGLAESLNVGRVEFLNGNFAKAHQAWLLGREEFKEDTKSNRIFDFFLAVNAISALRARLELVKGNAKDPDVVGLSRRAGYFLSSTFLQKKDSPDDRIDTHAPWGLYNLAAIYYQANRIRSVYGSAQEGLSVLLKQGRSEYRSEFRQLLAEAYIKNQDLMSAIQELDTAIRQDPSQVQATRMFSRAGDIYYDLNNYELAEDLYAMASAIDRERQLFNPMQTILRAESIFWLGRFDESERLFRSAVEYSQKNGFRGGATSEPNLSWAALRIADAALARAVSLSEKEKSEFMNKARLEYFRVESDFPRTEAAQIAAVRGACLELPTYQGNNVKHARSLLESVKAKGEAPPALMELVWACEAASYADRERSQVMLSKVREFSEKYPRSRFLDSMLPAVRDVQAAKINQLFSKKQWESATDFFEQRRSALFQKIPSDVAANLWTAYVATGRSAEAREFWPAKTKKIDSDTEALRQAAFLFEVSSSAATKAQPFSKERRALNMALERRDWSKKPTNEDVSLLKRILVTKDVASAYPWIMKIQDAWYPIDEASTCQALFPLLSRVYEDRKSSSVSKKMVAVRVKDLPEGIVNKIRSTDAACFQSWIDFEGRVLSTGELQKKYTTRLEWPLEGAWLESVWTLSESLAKVENSREAAALWETIAKKAPKESFEARMAKTRLDPRKTEFESLWK